MYTGWEKSKANSFFLIYGRRRYRPYYPRGLKNSARVIIWTGTGEGAIRVCFFFFSVPAFLDPSCSPVLSSLGYHIFYIGGKENVCGRQKKGNRIGQT